MPEHAALRNRRSIYLSVIALVAVLVSGLLFLRGNSFNFPGFSTRPGGITQKIGRNGDLQSAINRAQPGDVIVVDAQATYTGPFTLPKKSGNEFITIQSSRVAELPADVRVGPGQAELFARLQSATAGEPVIKTAPGAHHYRFIGVEISTATGDTKMYDLVQIGDTKQTSAQVPEHIEIDRSYIHGHPTQEVQRGVSLNGKAIKVSNSYISEIHGRGYDTQALCGWNGPGPFDIINNYLEAAGENVMFGGALPSIPGLVPSDITIRDNDFFKPLSWKVGHPTYAGIHWSIKNLLEFKNASVVTVEGNTFKNSWTDAQIGYAILFTVRSEDGKAPWATLENITFKNNIVSDADQSLQLLGNDSGRSKQAKGLTITHNLFTNIKNRFLTMSGYENVVIDHNTHFQNGNIMALHGEPSRGFVYTNNITVRAPSSYGIFGDGTGEGTAALTRFLPGYKMSRNIIIGAPASQYPPNNAYPATPEKVGFQDFNGGKYGLAAKSAYKNTSTEKDDPGVHVDRLPKR